MPKFAANLTWMFNEVPFLERFAAAADAGFKAVEYLFPYGHRPEVLAQRLREHGLIQAQFNFPAGDWQAGERGLAAVAGREADFRASVARAVEYALATGGTRLHLVAGIASPADSEARALYFRHVGYAAERLAAHGLMLLIEPINRRDIPGYFLDDFALAEEVIAELQRPNLRLQYDIYHRQIMHGDVARSLERLMPIIGHIQVASVPHRHEPNSGELNDDYVFGLLDGLGYAGYVGCEYRPAGGTRAGLGWLQRWPRR